MNNVSYHETIVDDFCTSAADGDELFFVYWRWVMAVQYFAIYIAKVQETKLFHLQPYVNDVLLVVQAALRIPAYYTLLPKLIAHTCVQLLWPLEKIFVIRPVKNSWISLQNIAKHCKMAYWFSSMTHTISYLVSAPHKVVSGVTQVTRLLDSKLEWSNFCLYEYSVVSK